MPEYISPYLQAKIKTFNQERLDLGIYKAVGFNTNNLRNTMALRFTIASTIVVLLGIVLSILFSNLLSPDIKFLLLLFFIFLNSFIENRIWMY